MFHRDYDPDPVHYLFAMIILSIVIGIIYVTVPLFRHYFDIFMEVFKELVMFVYKMIKDIWAGKYF